MYPERFAHEVGFFEAVVFFKVDAETDKESVDGHPHDVKEEVTYEVRTNSQRHQCVLHIADIGVILQVTDSLDE